MALLKANELLRAATYIWGRASGYLITPVVGRPEQTRPAIEEILRPLPDEDVYAFSVRLEVPPFELEAPLANLNEMLERATSPVEGRKMAIKEFEDQLQKALPSPDMAPQFENAVGKLTAYREGLKAEEPYRVVDRDALSDSVAKLAHATERAENDWNILKNMVESFANKAPDDPVLAAEQAAKLQGDELKHAGFDEIATFLLTADAQAVHARLPYLTDKEIQALLARTIDVLRLGAYAQRLNFMHLTCLPACKGLPSAQGEVERLGSDAGGSKRL